jgi:hypothetical protein
MPANNRASKFAYALSGVIETCNDLARSVHDVPLDSCTGPELLEWLAFYRKQCLNALELTKTQCQVAIEFGKLIADHTEAMERFVESTKHSGMPTLPEQPGSVIDDLLRDFPE